MVRLRVQTTIAMVSNIPADYVTNTWHFDADEGVYEAPCDALTALYNSLRPYFPATVSQSNHKHVVYRLADPEPRAPVFEEFWTFTSAPTGFPLPSEAALCLSYQAEQISGQPQARRRGRAYMGPLNTTTLESTTGRPASSVQTAFSNAGDALLTASDAATDWYWSTWSVVDNAGYPVDNGWVDNAYDIQRRRGLAPTARVVFS